jgi:hypothetical protein
MNIASAQGDKYFHGKNRRVEIWLEQKSNTRKGRNPMKTATLKTFILAAVSGLAVVSMPAAALTVDATQASFQYGLGQAGITTANNRHIDGNALGANTSTFRSLGLNGAAVFGFGTAFSGDVKIWETTFNTCSATASGTCSHWPEKVSVFAGNSWDFNNPDFLALDTSTWTSLGVLGNADAQGGGILTTSGVFNYLLLVDNGLTTPNPKDGFDVARVSVSAVPIPAAGWLFGSALIGLAAAARRRKAA